MKTPGLIFGFVIGLILMPTGLAGQVLSKVSIGLSAGGTGLAGVPIQYRLGQNLALDVGIYGRTAHVDIFEPHWYVGLAADAGLSVFFGHREKPGKAKVVYNGLFVKGGIGLHALQEYTANLGWVHEVYSEKHPQRFVQFQIGPSIRHRTETFMNTRYPPGYQEQTQAWYSAMIYTRLTWFFSLKK
ncbi:MAG: hypothetical protein J7L96_06030 [Bacteroidales bacterium]|nr:hypothetical protein [Bacteroidales bacterium]